MEQAKNINFVECNDILTFKHAVELYKFSATSKQEVLDGYVNSLFDVVCGLKHLENTPNLPNDIKAIFGAMSLVCDNLYPIDTNSITE